MVAVVLKSLPDNAAARDGSTRLMSRIDRHLPLGGPFDDLHSEAGLMETVLLGSRREVDPVRDILLDRPGIQNLDEVPHLADVTEWFALARFHGRNSGTWDAKGLSLAAQWFDYYDKATELEEWVPKIEMLREQADQLHLVMNTNNRDQAIANARALGDILQESTKRRTEPRMERLI